VQNTGDFHKMTNVCGYLVNFQPYNSHGVQILVKYIKSYMVVFIIIVVVKITYKNGE